MSIYITWQQIFQFAKVVFLFGFVILDSQQKQPNKYKYHPKFPVYFYFSISFLIILFNGMPVAPKSIPTYAAATTITLLLAACTFGIYQLTPQTTFSTSDFIDQQFNFHVYCPWDPSIASKIYQNTQSKVIKAGNPYSSRSSNNCPDTTPQLYLIYIRAKIINGVTRYLYCSYARQWDEPSCANKKLVCTSPGPMFYFPTGQHVDVVWVNDIDGESFPEENPCPYKECGVQVKGRDNSDSYSQCTYPDPTDLGNVPYRIKQVNSTRDPHLAVHIHGLENRPVFDGGPLSWWSKTEKGIGFQSLSNDKYFLNFQQSIASLFNLTASQKKSMKVDRYINEQQPGNLWYHDHAMKSTEFNVVKGLAGIYILYKKSVQSQLPKGSQQKFLLLTPSQLSSENPTTHQAHSLTSSSDLYSFQSLTNPSSNYYQRNMTYRIRILNANIQNLNEKVRFVTYHNGKQEINPAQATPQTTHILNFTVIGTDSTLFRYPVHRVNTIQMGNAERVQVLIIFQPNNSVPYFVNNVYFTDGDQLNYQLSLADITSLPVSANKYKRPQQIKFLDVSFTDLRKQKPSSIALRRMRPLCFSKSNDQFVFFINGHYMYGDGTSQNPEIGTTEDWYIINTVPFPHPIHVHLVNFQVIQRYSLKMDPTGKCTLYLLDFYKELGVLEFATNNYTLLCSIVQQTQISDNVTIINPKTGKKEQHKLEMILGKANLENTSKLIDGQLVSGKDVMEKYKKGDVNYDPNCKGSLSRYYKYICEDKTAQIPDWYKNWKDTALVQTFEVFVFRIRWTSTNYERGTGIVPNYPYFPLPQDQMIEFPGYVFHCHILDHEDNQMMRPIMLQPSKQFLATQSIDNPLNPCDNTRTTWKQRVSCINKNSKCGP